MHHPFEDEETVDYPCVHHGSRSRVKFEFQEVMTIKEAKQRKEVREIDLDTFMRVNDGIDDESELRWYECSECGGTVLFFPETYIQYVV